MGRSFGGGPWILPARSSCPVPIVMAGGKKLPELDALTMAYNAVQGGAAGVDMGRNIFQSDSPIGMLRAIRAVVHDSETPEHALEIYEETRAHEGDAARAAAPA